MTPKDKAFELVTKYSRILPINQTTLLDHKHCTLVTVDEILSTMDEEDNYIMYNYWIKVKKEIEKI